MSETAPLPVDRLYRKADLSALTFATTADLAPTDRLAGQDRARDALRVGTRIGAPGFNIFAIGSSGARIQRSIKNLLRDAAKERPAASDWVYVNNFADSHRPSAIRLPRGTAPLFQQTMHRLIDDLKAALPGVFESEAYQTRRGAIDEAIRSKGDAAFSALRDKAAAHDIVILRTPTGFAMAPAKNGEVVPPEVFNALPEDQRHAIEAAIHELEHELELTLRGVPRLDKERRDAIRALDQETARFAVGQSIEEARARLADLPMVLGHLDAVREDLVQNVHLFIAQPQGPDEAPAAPVAGTPFDRYEVNVLVTPEDHDAAAPVIDEAHPTLANLVGRVEHLAVQGALVTNFRLIRPGALHRANGGTIMLDARNLLMEPLSWPALKRALSRREIQIEDASRLMGFSTILSLEPDPIPLDVKVVLYGDRTLYYLLAAADPDFAQDFKILADFDDDTDRSAEGEAMFAGLIASIVARESLPPLDRDAVCLAIEHASRAAEDAHKLTLATETIRDLLVEAGYWASEAGRTVIGRADVDRAIDEQTRRASRIRERSAEMILRDIMLIDTAGTAIGQINGLSVMSLGGFAFGRPTRITCRVHPGSGGILDIEREVKTGGPSHSSGVLILSGFLAGRFATDAPISLSASLVFEQSYGGVDGDSASSTELYALLSALSEVPLRQDLAVTGSVNQHGNVQAIGGVNDKIEGYFEICRARGLTGTQGVMIPVSNVQHLMLRQEVVEACAAGQFAIYPIESIDQGIALLTGLPAAEVNAKVEARLKTFAKARKSAAAEAKS
jgi:lon-related putative ATP-dependent protease